MSQSPLLVVVLFAAPESFARVETANRASPSRRYRSGCADLGAAATMAP
jgi:hypothetical protein